jgi:2-(1,2-epoxy-1,2-dihydrophenyl)acetyl-CoA isomerase
MSEPTVIGQVAGAIGTVRLNRPAALNALDGATKDLLLVTLRQLAADPDVRCVVLTGTGRAFCVGQDLREHVQRLAADNLDVVWATVPDQYNPIARVLHEMPKPVVAAVNGIAAGAGASLAMLADLRILHPSAGFNLAFSAIALSCDTGSSWTLPRLVGPTKALELLYQPRTVGAEEARDLGLASEVTDAEGFDGRVEEVAARLAAGPTLAYAAIRQSVAYGAGRPLAESLGFEAEMMRRTGSSADHRAAVEAFLAKRPATFTGR